jgi:hypothetical protein
MSASFQALESMDSANLQAFEWAGGRRSAHRFMKGFTAGFFVRERLHSLV